MRNKLVLDTNIIIALDSGNLLNAFSALPYDILAPDVVVEELIPPESYDLTAVPITIFELPGPAITEVGRLSARYPSLSPVDLFALVGAKRLNAILLTGDKGLRNAAKTEGLEVRGMLLSALQMVDISVRGKGLTTVA